MNIKTIHFLSKLKNSSLIGKESIIVDCNKFILKLLPKLYNEGYILSFRVKNKASFQNNTREALVSLRYYYNKPIFNRLKIASKPSFQLILSYKNICRIVAKKRFFLFSTNIGLLTLNECKKHRKGGILLFSC